MDPNPVQPNPEQLEPRPSGPTAPSPPPFNPPNTGAPPPFNPSEGQGAPPLGTPSPGVGPAPYMPPASLPPPPPPPPGTQLQASVKKTYEVDAYGARVKVRDPVMVTVLSIITLGIYQCVWWYKINREMRDFGRVYREADLAKTNPVLSLLAITLGLFLIVPPFVSVYNTVRRIQTVQRIVHGQELNGWIIGGIVVASLFFFLIAFAGNYVMQDALNKAYNRYPRRS